LSYVIGYDTKPPAITKYVYAALTIIPLVTLRNRAINLMGALVGFSFLYSYVEMKAVWFSRLVSGGCDSQPACLLFDPPFQELSSDLAAPEEGLWHLERCPSPHALQLIDFAQFLIARMIPSERKAR
jgi:hypothetical protein